MGNERKYNTIQAAAFGIGFVLLITFVIWLAGCSKAAPIVKPVVDQYCNNASPAVQAKMREEWDKLLTPHQIRVYCNAQPSTKHMKYNKPIGVNTMKYVQIVDISVAPTKDSPLLHCVDECVRLAAETGCNVLLETTDQNYLFTSTTKASYVTKVKEQIHAYQKQKAAQLSLVS